MGDPSPRSQCHMMALARMSICWPNNVVVWRNVSCGACVYVSRFTKVRWSAGWTSMPGAGNWVCRDASATASRRLTERRGWGPPSLQNEASLCPSEYCSRTWANRLVQNTARSGHMKLYMHAPTAAVLKFEEKQEFAGIET